MSSGVFITSTGTSAGKTFVSRGLAAAAVQALHGRVAALKPLETGCQPEPLDALALGRACGAPELGHAQGFYRVEPPVAPYAATLMGLPAPDFEGLVQRVREVGEGFEHVVVEGAGGLLVPLDETRDIADLARALAFPMLLVAPNRLGVLSDVFALAEISKLRALPLAAIVLTEIDSQPDPSRQTNAAILRSRIRLPILSFAHAPDDDAALAAAARASGVLQVLGWTR